MTAGKDRPTLSQVEPHFDHTNENTQQFTEEQGEFLDMQTANLLEFGAGGGLYGEDRDVILKNWRAIEHSFEKLAADKKTVVEKYPPGCHVAVDIYVEDRAADEPEFMTQYYPVGDLPAQRMIELGFQPRQPQPGQKPQTGGYRPSVDGENPAPEGPFIVLEGRSDIWNGAPYAQLMDEFKQLGIGQFGERLAAQGLAALNGLRVHLGTKALPKSKRQQQEEKLSGQEGKSRSILVPVRINAWPWDQPAAAQTVQPAAAAAAPAPAPVAAQPVAAAPAAATAAGNGADADAKVVEYVQKAIQSKNGFLNKSDLGVALMPLLSKEGENRMKYMQTAHKDEFLLAGNGKHWMFDGSALMAMPQ